MLLRSSAEHGGAFSWTMIQATNVQAGGAQISLPDYHPGAEAQPAVVPGTVLNSLVRNGVYPEPYFGLNNAHEQHLIPDLSETGPDFYTYWFRTEFKMPSSFEGRQVWLELDGINYRATVWMNGKAVGNLAGMFQRGLFNVTAVA